MATDEIFTDADVADSARYDHVLGPAYFAARRIAERMFTGADEAPMKEMADKAAEMVRERLYDYIEAHLLSDLEMNVQHHLSDMVERTIQALLTGEAWAIKRYALADRPDAERVREAVAKHGGEPLLMARIADLEKEIGRLNETLRFMRS